MESRILTSPFIVVKSDTGVYALCFSIDGERIELIRGISKEAFETKLKVVFKDMNKHSLPGSQGPTI
jgi:hypothetical protein